MEAQDLVERAAVPSLAPGILELPRSLAVNLAKEK
jgi:hypothetical protein